MHVRKWSNILLGLTCALCIFIAFLVFITALIYLSVFVISSSGSATACSRIDQIKGIECAPKIEKLSSALEHFEPSFAEPERFQKIAALCNSTLECVEPVKCKRMTQDYEYVKSTCYILNLAANDINFCLEKLQKRLLEVGEDSCLLETSVLEYPEDQLVCRLLAIDQECTMSAILETCGEDVNAGDVMRTVLELFDCQVGGRK